jgi:hypothetical protein
MEEEQKTAIAVIENDLAWIKVQIAEISKKLDEQGRRSIIPAWIPSLVFLVLATILGWLANQYHEIIALQKENTSQGERMKRMESDIQGNRDSVQALKDDVTILKTQQQQRSKNGN